MNKQFVSIVTRILQFVFVFYALHLGEIVGFEIHAQASLEEIDNRQAMADWSAVV